jgi:bZIP transcription factor
MGDYGGSPSMSSGAQQTSTELSFLPHAFSSFDFLQRQNSFGFSPGTSPVPNDINNDGVDSFFGLESRTLPIGQSNPLPANDPRYSSMKHGTYHSASQHSVHQPSRLRIPSTTTKQKHGQLTPPSETSPTKESPPAELSHGLLGSPADSQNGAATRKRRGTQPSQTSESLSRPTATPRRRKKSARKQTSSGSTAEGEDKRSQFLERNRVAASKCRQKKKEWTSNLEERARELQASKTSLALLVSSLREELLYLKGEALRHTTCDCNSVREYLARHAEASLPRSRLDYATSPHSGSNFSFKGIDIDPSIMHSSPKSSVMADNHDLPELSFLGQIPD